MMGTWAMRRRLNTALRYVLLAVAAVVVVFPIYYAVATSLFTAPETLVYPPKFFTARPYWESYREALRRAPVFLFIRNSFLVSVGVTLGQLVTSSLAAYAFTFLRFRGRDTLFFVILSTMMIPWEVTLVPNYMLINKLGWVDTFQGLIVPFLADAFGIFLLRQWFLTIPYDLKDAASIDGCSDFGFFRRVVIPLARPALGTLAVRRFLTVYNQYLWPLLITNSNARRTVQIGLAMLQWDESVAWNSTMAGVVMAFIPTTIVLMLGYRQLVQGLTAGAIKG